MRTPSKLSTLAAGLALCAGLAFSSLHAAPKAHPDTTGWEKVFAEDFSNAVTKPGDWVFENGVLASGEAPRHDLDEEILRQLRARSRVQGREGSEQRRLPALGRHQNVLSALEIQVHENQDSAHYGMVGAIYNAQPPAKAMAKPVGEWNRFTITCNDSRVSLIFNGEEVYNVDLNDWKEPKKNPDGSSNKFAKALKDFSRNGPIGLQGLHGKAQAPVWYRNIRIKELK